MFLDEKLEEICFLLLPISMTSLSPPKKKFAKPCIGILI